MASRQFSTLEPCGSSLARVGRISAEGGDSAIETGAWYPVRGPDKKCQIVEKRPSEYQAVIVGDNAYVSRNEAPEQLRWSGRTSVRG